MITKKIKLTVFKMISEDFDIDHEFDFKFFVDEIGNIKSYTIEQHSIDKVNDDLEEAINDILSDYPDHDYDGLDDLDDFNEEDEMHDRIHILESIRSFDAIEEYVDEYIEELMGQNKSWKSFVEALREEGYEIDDEEV